jgi:hypothetical protein
MDQRYAELAKNVSRKLPQKAQLAQDLNSSVQNGGLSVKSLQTLEKRLQTIGLPITKTQFVEQMLNIPEIRKWMTNMYGTNLKIKQQSVPTQVKTPPTTNDKTRVKKRNVIICPHCKKNIEYS